MPRDILYEIFYSTWKFIAGGPSGQAGCREISGRKKEAWGSRIEIKYLFNLVLAGSRMDGIKGAPSDTAGQL
jgi:hypothetical protein